MKPPAGDPDLLLRAAGRCMALARELDSADATVSSAARRVTPHWFGAGADAFGTAAGAQRSTVRGAQAVVERLAALSRTLAHELADEQARARRAEGTDPAAMKASDDRIALLHKRFRLQLRRAESDLTALLTGRIPAVDGDRWTGPPMVTGPIGRLPVDPPRWKGPIRPPGGVIRPNWKLSKQAAAPRLPWSLSWQRTGV